MTSLRTIVRTGTLMMAGMLLGSMMLGTTAMAQESSQGEWLPQSGVKWHYSPLAVPTQMEPMTQSMSLLLSRGYAVKSTNNYKNGLLFILVKGRNNVMCVFNPPEVNTDQKVPTSRCWALN